LELLTNPSALTSAAEFLYVVRVIVIFGILWIGLPAFWILSATYRKMRFKQVADRSKRRASVGNFMQEPSRLNASKVLIDYASSILPVMFTEKGVFERCWDIMKEKIPLFHCDGWLVAPIQVLPHPGYSV
jgi:hypothetical protein